MSVGEVAEGEIDRLAVVLCSTFRHLCALRRSLDAVTGPASRECKLAAFQLSRALHPVRQALADVHDGMEVVAGHRLPPDDA